MQITNWDAPDASASWNVYIPAAGNRAITVCYASTVETAGQFFTVSAGNGLEPSARVRATHLNWSEFRPISIGQFNFRAPGYYAISLFPKDPVDRELFKLLWIHVGETAK